MDSYNHNALFLNLTTFYPPALYDDFINDANNLQLDEKVNSGENVNQMYDIFIS